MSGGMGAAELTWQEIDAWCGRTGIDLDPWEARTIRRLSRTYVHQQHDARKPDCPEPYADEVQRAETAKNRVSGQFKAMLAAFGAPPK